MIISKYDGLRDLVAFVKLKKFEKHPGRGVTFSACNFTKSNTPPGCFPLFLNGTKSRKASQISEIILFAQNLMIRMFQEMRLFFAVTFQRESPYFS